MYLIVVYQKIDDMIYLGHLDFMNLWEKMLRILDLPIAFSQGMHKTMKFNLIQPLSLGVEGMNELLHVELTQDVDLVNLKSKLITLLPEGIKIKKIVKTKYNSKWFNQNKVAAKYQISSPKKISDTIATHKNILQIKTLSPTSLLVTVINNPALQTNIKEIILTLFPKVDIIKMKRVSLIYRVASLL